MSTPPPMPPGGGPAGPPGAPPYGVPYGWSPGRPSAPPRRRRSKWPLVVVLALAVLGALVTGIVYYEQSYKPRHYLREWSYRIGSPQGRFEWIEESADDHTIQLRFKEQCVPTVPCQPPPAKAIAEWVANDGGGVSERTVAECFRDADSFSYYQGKHLVTIRCQKVDSGYRYVFTARLEY